MIILKTASVLSICVFCSSLVLIAQEDCFVNVDQLKPPLQSDTIRQIDTELTYKESLYIFSIYDGKLVYDTTRIIDPETYEEKIYITQRYSTRDIEADYIVSCGPKTFFFKQKGNCLQLYQIKEKHIFNSYNTKK